MNDGSTGRAFQFLIEEATVRYHTFLTAEGIARGAPEDGEGHFIALGTTSALWTTPKILAHDRLLLEIS